MIKIANCDLCGRNDKLIGAIVEGSMLSVCQTCSKFGHVVPITKPTTVEERPTIIKREPEEIEIVMEDYAEKIKQAREESQLKQEELAQKIGEKESIIQKIESKHITPSIDLARKLEKFFQVKLIEKYEEKSEKKELNISDKTLTIGDLIKIRKKDE